VPTARDCTKFELLHDFDIFCNKLRNIKKGPTNRTDNKLPRRKNDRVVDTKRAFKSTPALEGILGEIKNKISEINNTDFIRYNLTKSEHASLRELCQDKSLVIQKCDKGADIVVQNRCDYVTEGLTHLQDPVTYRELDGDPTNSICNNINKFLLNLFNDKLLDKESVEFCYPPKNARLARLYFLKKTHKCPMGVRPIVSSCDSPTENISQYIDHWFQPIMKELPSYLKDTNQLIRELRDLSVPQNVILATVDVKSLYTCIPHEDGIAACKEALENSEVNNPEQPDSNTLIKLLEIVLKNNTFEFDGRAFHQLQGTAMGTRAAPAYANIFMGKLEQTILSHAPLKPLYYRRYIDDIVVLWSHPMPELLDFLQSMNNFHPSIKFTFNTSETKITFLDINIFKGTHFHTSLKLDTETYIKPTNHQLYVHADSYHPPGTGKSVVIGELKRYLRTNSCAKKFYDFKSKHKINLRKRGYSLRFIRRNISKVDYSDRISELYQNTSKSKRRKILPFVTRYTPSATKVIHILKRYWPAITQLQQFNNVELPVPMLAFKRNRNLRSYLVRAKLPPLDPPTLTPIDYSLNWS